MQVTMVRTGRDEGPKDVELVATCRQVNDGGALFAGQKFRTNAGRALKLIERGVARLDIEEQESDDLAPAVPAAAVEPVPAVKLDKRTKAYRESRKAR